MSKKPKQTIGASRDAATTTKSASHDFLLPGEAIPVARTNAQPSASDEELNSRYVRGDIRIVTEQARYPLSVVKQMLTETVVADDDTLPRYDLDPEYQRRHRWTPVRKSRLIESFLMNVPVPPVFFYETEFARYEVMDGRQRLTAIGEFFSNEFALTELEHWRELEGRTYETLPGKIKDGIDRRYLSSIILLKETAGSPEGATEREANLKKLVFERLNSGGVRLSGQETRNAVYSGPLNALCLKLSAEPTFRKLWGIPDSPEPMTSEDDDEDDAEGGNAGTSTGQRLYEKMEDVELVLQFFAYRQIDRFQGALNKKRDFLDWFIAQGNAFSDEVLRSYEMMFKETVSLLWELFGSTAFHAGKRQKPTKIVYDPVMFVASSHRTGNDRELLLGNPQVIKEEFARMYEEHGSLFAGRSTNDTYVGQRNERVAESFDAALASLRSRKG